MKLQKLTIGVFLFVFISCGQHKSSTNNFQTVDTVVCSETKQLETELCQSDTIPNFDNEQAIAMLKEFYTSYLYAIDAFPYNEEKVDSIVNRYSTKQMLRQLEQADELGYDLFLNGNFFEIKWLETMSIYADSVDTNNYIVEFCYVDFFEREIQHRIKLHVVKTDNNYKIDKVLPIIHLEKE